MKEYELKEILDKCECHITYNYEAIVIMPCRLLETFTELLGYDYLCEGGIECRLLSDGNIGIEFTEIFENYDLNIKPFKSCFVESKETEKLFDTYVFKNN